MRGGRQLGREGGRARERVETDPQDEVGHDGRKQREAQDGRACRRSENDRQTLSTTATRSSQSFEGESVRERDAPSRSSYGPEPRLRIALARQWYVTRLCGSQSEECGGQGLSFSLGRRGRGGEEGEADARVNHDAHRCTSSARSSRVSAPSQKEHTRATQRGERDAPTNVNMPALILPTRSPKLSRPTARPPRTTLPGGAGRVELSRGRCGLEERWR